MLGEHVNLLLVLLGLAVIPQLHLGQGLVGEGGGHHEGRVSSGTTKVEEAALGKHDNTVSVGEHEAVYLGLDVLAGGCLHEASHVNLVVEVTDVSNDGVVLHLAMDSHMMMSLLPVVVM